MVNYSYNLDRKDMVFASTSNLNASFKDLCAVCDAVRYLRVPNALRVLDSVILHGRPIEYRRHNKYMGSRHELQGRKGRYPIKCAMMVKKVIVNAAANAQNKGSDPESMYVVHATANKGQIIPRAPPKGVRVVVAGGYGYQSMRTSNIEFAKIEIGLATKDKVELGSRMKRALKAVSRMEKPEEPVIKKKQGAGKATKPLLAPKPAKVQPAQMANAAAGEQKTKTV